MQGSLVAGARIRVRDSEWVVAHVDRSAMSGAIVHATGLSGIVRDKEAIFVEAIEKARGRGIEVVEPPATPPPSCFGPGRLRKARRLRGRFAIAPNGNRRTSEMGPAAPASLRFQATPGRC
jgi:hypothetical protein